MESNIENEARMGRSPIYLSFAVAGKVLALPIQEIREIVGYDQLIPAPGTPGRIRGKMADPRGSTVPVVDLAGRLGGRPTAIGQSTCIVILEVGTAGGFVRFGLVVDAVGNLMEIGPEQMGTCQDQASGDLDGLIQGIARTCNGKVLVLEAGRMLPAGEMAALCQAGP